MAVIGFLAHTQRPGAMSLAEETSEWLRAAGHETRMLGGGTAEEWPLQGLEGSLDGLQLVVSLGGDGTMLRAVDLVSPAGIPVMGVNLGHLGYLTTVEPEELRDALTRFLAGDYRIEERMTLEVVVRDIGSDEVLLRRNALNDAVLQREGGGHPVRAELSVNEVPFLTFSADSLIIATPTGSTAYNLSARGPIVSPRARVQIVTPVAPHMLFDRTLVLSDEEVVAIEALVAPAQLVVDGWKSGTVHPGQILQCRPGMRDALLVTFGGRDFHDILKRKFNLVDR